MTTMTKTPKRTHVYVDADHRITIWSTENRFDNFRKELAEKVGSLENLTAGWYFIEAKKRFGIFAGITIYSATTV